MNLENKTTQKIISFLLIIATLTPALLFFYSPKNAGAQWVTTDPGNTLVSSVDAVSDALTAGSNSSSLVIQIKNVAIEIGKHVLMTIARRLLQEMTKSTINWISSGFHGAPLFLQNPDSFFKDIAKYEIKTLVDIYGYDRIKFPFGRDFALETIATYKRQASENASYTLSKIMTDPVLIRSYREDFNVGGWNGFLINTQYPQNNYLGFKMIASEQLAQRLEGTFQNKAKKVQTAVQQGLGFLSPQSCPSRPAYNNGVNEFRRPSFDQQKFDIQFVRDHPSSNYGGDAASTARYNQERATALATAKTAWSEVNECPGGLENTTPGSVVANQITTALNIPMNSTLQAMGLGNSISAIFDALLNHFIDKGLNALASKINPTPPPDTWTYEGESLGTVSSNTRDPWDSGPDQPIILSVFKKAVDEGIVNTQTEILLMDNDTPINPGVTQLFTSIWQKVRDVDFCQPGPNMGWETRLDDERSRNELLFSEKVSDSNGETSAKAKLTQNELKFAVNFFRDWISNEMMTALPNSINYMDSIDELSVVQQQANELINAKRLKRQALARLKSIKTILNSISTPPEKGSGKEKILLDLVIQYKATVTGISNPTTIVNRQDELSKAKEQLKKLTTQLNECKIERTENGWSNPGGARSTFAGRSEYSKLPCNENASMENITPLPPTMIPGEDYNFTIRVTNTGESLWHNGEYYKFVKKLGVINISPSFGGLLYPVAANFSSVSGRFVDWTFSIKAPSTPGNWFLELQMVHKKGGAYVRLLDDTKTPLGTDSCSNTTPTSDVYFGDSIYISMSVVATEIKDITSIITFAPPQTSSTPLPPTPAGKEQELFCDWPIAGGKDHEMFKHSNDPSGHGLLGGIIGAVFGGGIGAYIGNHIGGAIGSPDPRVKYPDIPYVNATDVMSWRTTGSVLGSIFTFGAADTKHHVDIGLNCNIIYKSNILDYKGDLPGGTTVEPYEDSYAIESTREPDECSPVPTKAEKKESEDAVAFIIPLLEAIPKMSPIVSPPPQSYQDAVQAAVDQTNTKYPNVGAAYAAYVNDNVIAMKFNYIVGPSDHIVSNQVGIVTTWTNAWRVVCEGGGGGGGGGTCTTPPNDAESKHGNHTAEVQEAKRQLAAEGQTWVQGSPSAQEYECNRFKIVKRAAQLIGNGAGFLAKNPGQTQCEKSGVDIIAFPDGYIYDVLAGGSASSDGAAPQWSSVTCLPLKPESYKAVP